MPDPLHKVKFVFQSAGDPGTVWRVVRLHGREALSELYGFVLDLANEDLTADPDRLLGKNAQVELVRDAQVRRVSGVVHRVEHRGTTAGHSLCRVHVAPALRALSQRVNSRIFQDVTALDAVKKVLDEGLAPFLKSHRNDTSRAFAKREYCVQYRESDLDFVLRLMAEEGVAFYFDFSDPSDELLVLVDANEPYTPIATLDGGAVPIMGDEGGTAAVETVRHFDLAHHTRSTDVVVRDFDWTQPALDLTRESVEADDNGMQREVFEYPAPLTLGGYSKPRYTAEDGAVQARLRRESHKATVRRFDGDGYVTGFTPGFTFEVTGNGDPAFDGEYLITAVEHTGHAPEQLTNETAPAPGAPERYHNTFECIPKSVVFRPMRSLARPKVGGIQTATVSGPPGEEIYTDEHGRIKVQFHWDREGKHDAKASCWIRVMQPWAGAGWGFVWTPRVGMEVVVQFLEGNPDRPLVTGCVYNGQNTPPYPLPDDKTRSTIKSNSSPGGGGSNEIRFEDRAGAEEVYVHAQLDYNTVTERDSTTRTGRNNTERVGNNESVTVGGDRTRSVGHDETIHIGHDQKVTVDNDQVITVLNNQTRDVTVDQTFTVGANQAETIGGDRTTEIGGNDALSVGGDQSVSIGGDRKYNLAGDEKDAIGGDCTVTVGGDDKRTVGGDAKLSVSGNVEVSAGVDVKVDGGAKVMIQSGADGSFATGTALSLQGGTTVAITGATEITLSAGGGAIKISAAGVEISGPQVKIAGGMVDITGGLVKIN